MLPRLRRALPRLHDGRRGGGTDTLEFEGAGPITLAGFNGATQSIEAILAGARGLLGNESANAFHLSGLTSVSGLSFINARAGQDTVTGSGFADRFVVSGAEAELDAMNGGGGSDTLQVIGGGPVTLNGFNAGGQSIEVWEGSA